MTPSQSRRRLLRSLLPIGLAVVSGCNQPRPAQFELRAKDAVALNIVISSEDTNQTVYEKFHAFESDEVLKLGEDTLQHPPYSIEFRIDNETIWDMSIGTCNHIVVSVREGKDVEIVEHTAY